MQKNSNNQLDFLENIMIWVENGDLSSGDFLVLDNWGGHGALRSCRFFANILFSNSITLLYGPTYSPELNPCELVFNKVKNWLRTHRDVNLSFKRNIMNGFSKISLKDVKKFYVCCISSSAVEKKLLNAVI
eukprot:TRINITY_DN1603_c0_g3_i1.p1 TRINITY_DN1603_c0_g3~~TRINITY_DN1603_c0_g3_i1.p1  ORF type:complete len:131 (+),score=17.33 TRINITY_DN1603_c0_g3_i1:652-1044(+)